MFEELKEVKYSFLKADSRVGMTWQFLNVLELFSS